MWAFARAVCGAVSRLATAARVSLWVKFYVTYVTKRAISVIGKEALEQIDELLDELRKYSAKGAPIIVEGVLDEKALRELGVDGDVFRVSGSGQTALNFLERLPRHPQIVILTDFDRAGDELARFCAEHLQRLGIEPVVDLRQKLKMLLRKDIKDIQSLAKFIKKHVV